MIAALGVVASVILLCGVGLFVAGIISAWREIRAEKKAGLPVTRPGWRRADREARGRDVEKYAVPRGTGLVLWPLVAVGRADLAESYMRRRGGAHRDQG